MRLRSLFLASLVLLFNALPVFAQAPALRGIVVINEVLYDPPGDDAGKEAIELLNLSSFDVDIGNYWLCVNNDRMNRYVQLPPGTTVRANNVLVIRWNTLGLSIPDREIFIPMGQGPGGSGGVNLELGNANTGIVLASDGIAGMLANFGRPNGDFLVDYVQHGGSGGTTRAMPATMAGLWARPEGVIASVAEGHSIALKPPGVSNNLPSDYVDAAIPTIGALNGTGSLLDSFFAQVANGGGFVSQILVTNPSIRDAASGIIDFADDDGRALRLGILRETARASVAFSLQPLGSVIIDTDGAGATIAGSAFVRSDNPLGVAIVFTAGPAAGGLGSAGVGESIPALSFIVPVTRSATAQTNSGIALMSTTGSPATLELSLRGSDGREVNNGRTSIPLAARGHRAQFIDQIFPQADTRDFRGTLVVMSNQRVAATALILCFADPKCFTTLPVSPLR